MGFVGRLRGVLGGRERLPTERLRLGRLGVELCIPLHAMNRMIGLILLGGLEGNGRVEVPPYLLTQIGLALQNAALFAQQRLRLRRLSRAERLATAGELAASAAHEIRNPLTAISSAVQLMGEAFSPGNPRREVADSVMREIDRINQIVEGLLSFARPAEPSRETIHLRQVLEEGMGLVRTMAGKGGVEMEMAFDPFYTTKERGTGLGLPICYGIVRSHGGEIDIESAPGEGTVVRVEL